MTILVSMLELLNNKIIYLFTNQNILFYYRFEIIEFPAVLVDAKNRKIIDNFQAFVKPTINPKLSDFCIKLTGITQVNIYILLLKLFYLRKIFISVNL